MRETFQIRPIGILRSQFKTQKGTPIQSASSQGEKGVIEVFPEFSQALSDLSGFSHLWILYRFNRIDGESLKVIPYLDTRVRGVFSTRSPRRPNLIGLAAVKLDEINGDSIKISGIDMLDNTPIIDIKPYVPDFDCHNADRIGWYSESNRKSEKVLADDRFARNEMISYFGGRVLATCLSEKTGVGKKPTLSCKLIENCGVEGDGHANSARQVSILMAEEVESYNKLHNKQAGPGDFAENILSSGLDLTKASVKDKLRIGDALLEVTQIGKEVKPDHYSFYGDRLLPNNGVFCKVLESGTIRAGDLIVLEKKSD